MRQWRKGRTARAQKGVLPTSRRSIVGVTVRTVRPRGQAGPLSIPTPQHQVPSHQCQSCPRRSRERPGRVPLLSPCLTRSLQQVLTSQACYIRERLHRRCTGFMARGPTRARPCPACLRRRSAVPVTGEGPLMPGLPGRLEARLAGVLRDIFRRPRRRMPACAATGTLPVTRRRRNRGRRIESRPLR